MITSTKYIGLDVHTQSISIAVMSSVGKVLMDCVIETKASTILESGSLLRLPIRGPAPDIGACRGCANAPGVLAGSWKSGASTEPERKSS